MTDGTEIGLVGWHNMGEAEYHSDPCPTPSLSASCAKTIIGSSLLHAWCQHPKNPLSEPFSPSAAMDMGSAVHAAVFGGAKLHIIEADSFRTSAAKEARDKARSDGCIPMLEKNLPRIEAMAKICAERFEGLYGGPYHAERVAIWRCPRTGGWRRAMMDTSAKAAPIIVDLKTTEASIDDESCIKRVFSMGLHIQAAAYKEAMEQLNPEWAGRVRFLFQWQEQNAPYAMSRPIEMGEAAMTLGQEQWEAAGALWDKAIASNEFPAFGSEPTDASPPPWYLTEWEIRKSLDEKIAGVV